MAPVPQSIEPFLAWAFAGYITPVGASQSAWMWRSGLPRGFAGHDIDFNPGRDGRLPSISAGPLHYSRDRPGQEIPPEAQTYINEDGRRGKGKNAPPTPRIPGTQ
ncbi:uncharacterized protein N7518_009940 [Penicillium psychrosexuale]|uniref:uncharacterized protein n=1 Tax=Penicillium psychrosexuale TaxID=1002107 RepID=UPI0025453563|nr:uncharacterized protein N7518_009940 [Penicillium psychrosexuale]KAJ5781457.1 hypothetical protein N7518_009940 [Penicillium psychrosexuale]